MAPNTASLTTALFLLSLASSTSAVQFQNTTGTSSLTSGTGAGTSSASAAAASASSNVTSAVALDPTVTNCFVTIPDNALSAEGLATPFLLMPPCSMAVGTQQAFAEAAIFDPATGEISVYHPLILDAGKNASVAPVVPTLPAGASVGLWFGFNGDTLQLLDVKGKDTNSSPQLAAIKCVNGEPGISGDIFGQVSWCNTVAFFEPVNANIATGKTVVPPLGTDKNGQDCPSSRAFTVVDQDPSDNLPTQYLLLPDGSTIQDTAANRAKFPDATVINNASDEALIGDIIDPLIGCTPFKVKNLDDPGTLVSSLATQELQAGLYQKTPLALVPIGDPDCLLTASGAISNDKTNNYRIGVNQPLLNAANSDNGSTLSYCNNMVEFAPPWLLINEAIFSAQATPDPAVGNNLFTFLCNRYLQSFVNLACTPTVPQTLTCQLDGNGAATSCTIVSATAGGGGTNTTSNSTSTSASASVSLPPTTLLTSTLSSSSVANGHGQSSSSSTSLLASPTKNNNGTITLSSLSQSISALPTVTGSSSHTSAIVISSATGTASINSKTVTVKATSVPVASVNPHTTFSYEFPRHHHHGAFFGNGFNPVTVTHATGTTVVALSSNVAPVATGASQSTPVAVSAIQSVVPATTAATSVAPASAGPLGSLSSGVEAAPVETSSLPVYGLQSFGPTSFVTVTMTIMATPSCAPPTWY